METQTASTMGVSPVGKQEKITLDVTNLPTMEELERQYLSLVLEKTGGSKTQTAKILGFSIKTIYNKLDLYKANETAETVRTSP